MLKYKHHVSAMRITILLIHHITLVCVTADFRKTTDNSKFFSLPFHPQDSLLSTTKMSWFENWEPVHSFTETVRVGRGSSYLNVIIRYNNPGFGRGEFTVEYGWKQREQEVNGGRTLRVQTYDGQVFQITRRRRGEYVMETPGYWCWKVQCG